MNWDAVGAVAELVGALAVIVTIAYLAVQIRQNSKLVASSIAGSIRDALNETTRIIASDPAAARIFWAGIEDRSALSEQERHQFDALLTLTFFGQQEAFETSAFRGETFGLRWVLGYPGTRDWWATHSSTLSSTFRSHVDRILNERPPAV